MNERIKKIAAQAGIELIGNHGVETTQANFEKFAGFIIDVCVKIADETDYILSDRETYTVETKIEQYFGS